LLFQFIEARNHRLMIPAVFNRRDQLEDIVRRKEAERIQGKGQFWCGIGNSLGKSVCDVARAQGETSSTVFYDAREAGGCGQRA
jgi:hypothetical protein